MIRNLSILDSSGRSLVSAYFGECHSFGDDENLVTGFITALHSMGQTLAGRGVDEIHLGPLRFVILSERNILFAIAVEDEPPEDAKVALTRIADLFLERYGTMVHYVKEDDDLSIFQSFPNVLIEMGIAQTSCGKYPECEGCPDADKELPMSQFIGRVE
jgi:hypothetical protein